MDTKLIESSVHEAEGMIRELMTAADRLAAAIEAETTIRRMLKEAEQSLEAAEAELVYDLELQAQDKAGPLAGLAKTGPAYKAALTNVLAQERQNGGPLGDLARQTEVAGTAGPGINRARTGGGSLFGLQARGGPEGRGAQGHGDVIGPVAMGVINLVGALELEASQVTRSLLGAAIGQALVAMRDAAYVLRQAAGNATGENRAIYQEEAAGLERALEALEKRGQA
ncbi:MAG: hypothetical protein KatS3mg051_2028 [Anaerolineae bacterium]|nr:MAG: hypothetical protein KatS3mg051_2028 [Anaerolineae bacterium]